MKSKLEVWNFRLRVFVSPLKQNELDDKAQQKMVMYFWCNIHKKGIRVVHLNVSVDEALYDFWVPLYGSTKVALRLLHTFRISARGLGLFFALLDKMNCRNIQSERRARHD